MTKANKVLFITQEITPYVSESEMANIGRNLPQAIQEKGREIRTFMPKWGNINERRNQLHEVIRLRFQVTNICRSGSRKVPAQGSVRGEPGTNQ